jgi:hypothetical protein
MTILEYLDKWYRASRLSLNVEKTHFIQFTTKNEPHIDLDVIHANKIILNAHETKFIGLLGIAVTPQEILGGFTNFVQNTCYRD